MTDPDRMDTSAPATSSPGAFKQAWGDRAPWQRIAAIISLVLTLGSGVLVATSGAGSADRSPDDRIESGPAVTEEGEPRPVITDGLTQGLWQGPAPLPLPGEPGTDGAGDGDSGPVDPAPAASLADDGVDWSPALFKTGFSFFMGFALAFAVRSFVRISLVAIGLMGLMLFGLEYMGLITVEWGAMAERWDGAVGWLRPQLTSFHGFISGQLPSAAAATGGLVTGWRRG